MKNLFISIGSTSASAMSVLIDRLIDLDIYKPLDPDYKDMFVAIDTDTAPLDRLKSYNQGKIAHIFGISFNNSDQHVPSHEFLKKSFRADWTDSDMAIRAADKGVGGRRIKSYATLEWKGELSRLIDKFYEGVNNGNTDCRVFLVASAWGGTSSGMFQNVSDFVASKIYDKCGGANRATDFYTVLALPDFSGAMDTFARDYQGFENFAYLMRSIQQAGWRSSLSMMKDDRQEDLKFIFPEFSDFLFNDTTQLPVRSDNQRFCGNLSSLPSRAVIVIPSEQIDTTSNVIAEQLLLLAYLNIFEQPYSTNGASASGKFVDIRKDGNEDKLAVGINMVECQLKYGADIRETVERRLSEGWKRFYSEAVSHNPNTELFVRNFLEHSIKVPEDLLEKFVMPALGSFNSDNPDQVQTLKDSIDNFCKAAKNSYYDFPIFEGKFFEEMDAYAANLPGDDLLREAFYEDLVMGDVVKLYQEQLNAWGQAAEEDPDAKVKKIKRMIDNTAVNYKRLSKRSGYTSYIIRYCNGVIEVPEEYIRIAREEIAAELKALQKLLLIRATKTHLQLKENNEVTQNGNWSNVSIFFQQKAQGGKQTGGARRWFIRRVANPVLQQLLADPKLVQIKTSHFVKMMKSSGNTAELQSTFDQICNELIQQVVGNMANINNAQSCSMITLKGAGEIGCCPTYQLGPNENIPPYMFHFYAKCAGAGDIDWRDVGNLGFGSFLRCKASNHADTNTVDRNGLLYNVGLGVWMDDQVNYEGKKLPGMWLGSVDLGQTFKDVLNKAYAVDQRKTIQTTARRLEDRKIQCSQTLFEKVVLGAILGIIDAKLPKAGNDLETSGKSLTITIRVNDELKWSGSCPGSNLAELGLINGGSGCSLSAARADLIHAVMSWMRENAHGSCALADALQCNKLFSALLNQEHYVLENITMTPDAGQKAMIRELYAKLQNCVEVTTTPSGE